MPRKVGPSQAFKAEEEKDQQSFYEKMEIYIKMTGRQAKSCRDDGI